LASEFSNAGCHVVAISPDSVASHNKFKDKHALAITLAVDKDKEIAKFYGLARKKHVRK